MATPGTRAITPLDARGNPPMAARGLERIQVAGPGTVPARRIPTG